MQFKYILNKIGSNLNVYLTYLRGLEVVELEEGEMPMVKILKFNI